ncbi:hypothetical protein [Planctomicrobium piriforme]|uniref:Zinc-finger n=1 Tax=Planctomicrobium piriforme TaxID=1576369 RepID=A0A1I3FAE0_9PLAN|nr:hypothetical protein [Planctomicrobium piriforme]SFI07841.1 hypothetical protein SAMN05421753_105139 [Planctomicrobium piriforme]
MKCREAKREIALHLGHDQCEKFAWEEVRRHVAACADCREQYRQLKTALAVIEKSEAPASYEVRNSLWPELEARLDAPRAKSDLKSSKAWVPLVSVAAACLLFLTVHLTAPAPQGQPLPPAPVNRQMMSPIPGWPEENSRLSREAREAKERAERARELAPTLKSGSAK